MLTARRLLRLPRRRPAPLPDALRERLLAIAATAPPGRAIVPGAARGLAAVDWLWATPWMPLAASFALSIALGLAWGNPYRVGAATLERVQVSVAPATANVRSQAFALAAAAAVDLGQTVMAVLPGAGLRASRTITASLVGSIDDGERFAAPQSAEGGR